jgi:hypothetical protein
MYIGVASAIAAIPLIAYSAYQGVAKIIERIGDGGRLFGLSAARAAKSVATMTDDALSLGDDAVSLADELPFFVRSKIPRPSLRVPNQARSSVGSTGSGRGSIDSLTERLTDLSGLNRVSRSNPVTLPQTPRPDVTRINNFLKSQDAEGELLRFNQHRFNPKDGKVLTTIPAAVRKANASSFNADNIDVTRL